MKTRRNLALIVAAGKGQLPDSELPVQYMDLAGKPILARTIDCFEKSREVDEIVLVVSEDYLAYASQAVVDKFGYKKIHKIVTGGQSRQESVMAGLVACPRTTDKIAIHDGVRPFVINTLIGDLYAAANDSAAAIPGVHPDGTIKLAKDQLLTGTLSREDVFIAQTPQVFLYSKILEFHERALAAKIEVTDDAMLAERYGMAVKIIGGHVDNIKITSPLDLVLAREIIKQW